MNTRYLAALLCCLVPAGCGGDQSLKPSTSVAVVPGAPPPSGATPPPAPGGPAPSTKAGAFVGQDMTLVGDRIWIFDKSDVDHATRIGQIRNRTTFALIGGFRHNISHAATVDYAARADTMMIGNGGDGPTSVAPRIDLFPRFSGYGVGSFLDWYDPVGTPRLSIPLTVLAPDGRTVLRAVFADAGRNTANAVWIDDVNTTLVFGGGANGIQAVAMRLGRGREDYSATGYGTFTPGKGGTEFNGTAIVLASYTGPLADTTQGADWHDGKLYWGMTSTKVGDRALEVREYAFASGGTMTPGRRWFHQPGDAAGRPVLFETQGVIFRGNDLLVGGIRIADSYQSIYKFLGTTEAVDLLP